MHRSPVTSLCMPSLDVEQRLRCPHVPGHAPGGREEHLQHGPLRVPSRAADLAGNSYCFCGVVP